MSLYLVGSEGERDDFERNNNRVGEGGRAKSVQTCISIHNSHFCLSLALGRGPLQFSIFINLLKAIINPLSLGGIVISACVANSQYG